MSLVTWALWQENLISLNILAWVKVFRILRLTFDKKIFNFLQIANRVM